MQIFNFVNEAYVALWFVSLKLRLGKKACRLNKSYYQLSLYILKCKKKIFGKSENIVILKNNDWVMATYIDPQPVGGPHIVRQDVNIFAPGIFSLFLIPNAAES